MQTSAPARLKDPVPGCRVDGHRLNGRWPFRRPKGILLTHAGERLGAGAAVAFGYTRRMGASMLIPGTGEQPVGRTRRLGEVGIY